MWQRRTPHSPLNNGLARHSAHLTFKLRIKPPTTFTSLQHPTPTHPQPKLSLTSPQTSNFTPQMSYVEAPVPVGGVRGTNTTARSRVPHLSSKIFQDGGAVDCRCSPNSAMASSPVLQMSMNTTDRKLKPESKQLRCCQTC